MNKLQQLIQELCPMNVPYLQIKDISQVGTGNSNGNEAEDDGEYPFFIRSQIVKRKNNWEFDEEAIIIPGEGGIGEIYHYVNGKYALHQRVYRIHFVSDKVNTKFVFHYFRAFFKPFILKKAVSATVKSIRKPMIEDFSIPIPPPPVQTEIVRILDKFSTLTAELTAELQARKSQYEYYRNQLLDYSKGEVEWKTLGEVCEVFTGGEAPLNSTKGSVSDSVNKYPIYGNGVDIYGFTDSYRIDKDAVTISSIGANTGAIYFRKAYFTPIIRLKVVIPKYDNLLPKYIFYYLSSIKINGKKSSVPNMNAADVKCISIPIPPLAEQERIVAILDKFDTLTNSISEGLPKEIELRQKQYEYYRNMLLTFPQKTA